MNNFKNNNRRTRFKPNGDGVLEEMEMGTSPTVILVTDPLSKEETQEKIIKMLQNLLRNIMI